MDEKNKEDLLAMPICRQAYSDNTAWVITSLSELFYLKHDPSFSDEKLSTRINNLIE